MKLFDDALPPDAVFSQEPGQLDYLTRVLLFCAYTGGGDVDAVVELDRAATGATPGQDAESVYAAVRKRLEHNAGSPRSTEV